LAVQADNLRLYRLQRVHPHLVRVVGRAIQITPRDFRVRERVSARPSWSGRRQQFNRESRLLVPWWRASPLGMLWPKMNIPFVTSGG
jgi:hypothetical protein